MDLKQVKVEQTCHPLICIDKADRGDVFCWLSMPRIMSHTSRFACVAAVLLCLASYASGTFPTLGLKPVVLGQFHAPTTITRAPDGSGRLFVCDQPGKIYIIERGMLLPKPFLNIANPANPAPDAGPGPVIAVGASYTERGLLGLTFHPGFADAGSPGHRKFYVNYSAPNTHPTLNPVGAGGSTDHVSVIAEYQVSATDPNAADPASARIVLTYGQPQSNHNGGQLEFGPDGLLYIATGDGGGSRDNQLGHTEGVATQPPSPNQHVTGGLGNGQDRRTLLGKILRINPLDPDAAGPLTYSIPAENPFVGQTQDFVNDDLDGPMRGEIYAYGLRNPWRFCFDANFDGAPRLICADVGQGDVEEIDFIVSGGNYGWRMREGSVAYDLPTAYADAPSGVGQPAVVEPIAVYAHPNATLPGTASLPKLGRSITGGYVYRGTAISGLQGKYLCADYALNGIGTGGGIFIGVEPAAPGVYSVPAQVPVFNPLPTSARIYCFGVDDAGEMYVGVKTTSGVLGLDSVSGLPAGGIYKFVPVEGTASLIAQKDNSIFSENGGLSDGRGFLYAGKTGASNGFNLRRALIAFDTAAAIPPGAQVLSASVRLRANLLGPSATGTPLALHRLNETWGEGTSQATGGTGTAATAGDATWTQRFFDTTPWTTAGGAFATGASATTSAVFGTVTFVTNAQMVADVQGWLDAPASNAGWILRGDEGTDFSAVKFDSLNQGTTAPQLDVNYLAITETPGAFETWLALHFPGLLVGQYLDPNGDAENDGIKNLLEFAFGLNPNLRDPGTNFTAAMMPADAGGTDLVLTFRRNTDANDLSFRLQISPDLTDWSTTIAESVNGGDVTALNEAEIVSEEFLEGSSNLVTVRLNFPEGISGSLFSRVQVDWP